jgi:hypothetical protein
VTVRFFGDLVGGLGPHEGVAAVVRAVDERSEFGVPIANAAEGAPVDGLPLGDPEPDLDEVKPRPDVGVK